MDRKKTYDRTKVVNLTDDKGIEDLAMHLRDGEVIGFPTETVYGLGADAFSAD